MINLSRIQYQYPVVDIVVSFIYLDINDPTRLLLLESGEVVVGYVDADGQYYHAVALESRKSPHTNGLRSQVRLALTNEYTGFSEPIPRWVSTGIVGTVLLNLAGNDKVPDVTNFQKQIEDACNRWIWEDDVCFDTNGFGRVERRHPTEGKSKPLSRLALTVVPDNLGACSLQRHLAYLRHQVLRINLENGMKEDQAFAGYMKSAELASNYALKAHRKLSKELDRLMGITSMKDRE